MTTRVKICGLRDAETLKAAIDAGADFIGFVDFPKSPRHIMATGAAKLIAGLPPHVSSVIVTVDPSDEWLAQVDSYVSPTYIQLHGDESPERVNVIRQRLHNTKIIKAIAVSNADDIARADAYGSCAHMLLFDTKVERLHGGSGKAFNWSLLEGRQIPLPWMLSGGLTPENVSKAISQTGATMVDVSSGVESTPGVKDSALIKQFIEAAKKS
jgi:phosphoribosylanthranilate isomerase